jgi:hypothetical protein
MEINSDYKDLLRGLNAAGVRSLVIGGYAVMAYTEPQYTKDLEFFARSRNSARLSKELPQRISP